MNEKTANGDETKMDFTPEELKTVPTLSLLAYYGLIEHIAIEIETQFAIPRIIPIVQSAHESRNGNSGLARNHCNLFGIVATDSWKKKNKPVALMPTWEHIKGKDIQCYREFRAYATWKESFFDWAGLIVTLNCYKKAYDLYKQGKLVEGITDMATVYATDPAYARKLVDLYRGLSSATGGTK